MDEVKLGLMDGAYQNDSDLRIVLQKLVEVHGVEVVKQVLRSIENPRSRGRPRGRAIDDWPLLTEAAAIWRDRGGGAVWPALIAVAELLPGEPNSHARRLLSRLLERSEPSIIEQFQQAGIKDFWIAAWDRKIHRIITRAGPRYKEAFLTVILAWMLQNRDPHPNPVVNEVFDMALRCSPPLTLEEIRLLIEDSPAAKFLPFHLVSSGSDYYLIFGHVNFIDSSSTENISNSNSQMTVYRVLP
jgi:hypothetical protein